MEAANARLAAFSRRVRVAAAAAVAAATAAGVAMVRSGLQTVDAQAKLAQSLGTTVASIQTLERAGELAGVSMSGIEQATKDLTRRLGQAAAGTGPAADALERLGLPANDLIALPLDQRVGAINAAIEEFVPAVERAAVAGQLFGEEGSIAMSRIDTETLRQATEDVRAFGVVVSEQDADQIGSDNVYIFDQKELTFAAGETVRLHIVNEGEEVHEFVMDTMEANAEHKELMAKFPEMEHDDPNAVRLEPGQEGEILWTFVNAGTFEFACLLPGHYEAGMHGPLIVN